MADPQTKLAHSLEVLRTLQAHGRRVFQSKEFSRIHRERLLRSGFLKTVMKGWLISVGPGTPDGDSTPWFASFWEFCSAYCRVRFGNDWHLSPEQSLLLHAGNTAVPKQVIIYSGRGNNNTIELPFSTSLYDLKQQTAPREDVAELDGLRIYARIAALIRVPESFYHRHLVEAQVVLSSSADPGDLLRSLLGGGHSAIAGRLVGAYRHIGRHDVADEISATMRASGYEIRESNPFEADQQPLAIPPTTASIVARLYALWETQRVTVLDTFVAAPGLPTDHAHYMRLVDDNYTSDAYHSLSIEGYRVTPELIERVRSGRWDPEHHEADPASRDALAARGYWQSFQLVRDDVVNVITGSEPGNLTRHTHRDWYRELFQPSVAAGIIGADALAGYRNRPVFIRGSRHVPPRWEALRDALPALFDLLSREREPSVRAVLAHWLFGYIHPYPDGNGRIARFLMNVMLASGGYPWTIIRVESRNDYLNALEAASVDSDIGPFAQFIAKQVQQSMEQTS